MLRMNIGEALAQAGGRTPPKHDMHERIIRAALFELNAKLSRGIANSGLEQETLRMLREPVLIHDSYVRELMVRWKGFDALTGPDGERPTAMSFGEQLTEAIGTFIDAKIDYDKDCTADGCLSAKFEPAERARAELQKLIERRFPK